MEIRKTLQVAFLTEQHYSRAEIEKLTGQTQVEIRGAMKRLEQVAEQIDRDSEFS